jgi:hypothetical protein
LDNIVTVTTGDENIPGASATVTLTATHGGKRLALTYPPTGTNEFPAGRALRPEICGVWRTQSFDLPDNTVIVLTGRRTPRGGAAVCRRIVIKVDQRAPHQQIVMPTSRNERSALDTARVTGKFWILPVEEAAEFVRLSRDSLVDPERVFDLPVVLTAGQERPILATKDVVIEGETVAIPTTRRRRALRL